MMIVRKLPVLMPGTTAVTTVKVKNLPIIVTGRNEVVAKVMFLQLCVILFMGRKRETLQGDPLQGDPPRRRHPQGDPPRRRPPQEGVPPPGLHPRGKLRGIRSRPTSKVEIEGDQIQAHTQEGTLGGSDPGSPSPPPPPKKQTPAYD